MKSKPNQRESYLFCVDSIQSLVAEINELLEDGWLINIDHEHTIQFVTIVDNEKIYIGVDSVYDFRENDFLFIPLIEKSLAKNPIMFDYFKLGDLFTTVRKMCKELQARLEYLESFLTDVAEINNWYLYTEEFKND